AGCMALPRVLSLDANGDLEMRFAAESQSLREKQWFGKRAPVGSLARALQGFRIANVAGEFCWATESPRSTFALQDRGGPWLSLTLEPQDASTVKLSVNGKSVDLPMRSEREFRFHLLLDASVGELICNARHALTTRIYRQPDGPLGIRVDDSDLAKPVSLEVWQLRPISSDRLTS
ncbi:MAG TPA: hypothetical protein VF740_06380, partial [Candidatus Acidoferrum sp.]